VIQLMSLLTQSFQLGPHVHMCGIILFMFTKHVCTIQSADNAYGYYIVQRAVCMVSSSQLLASVASDVSK